MLDFGGTQRKLQELTTRRAQIESYLDEKSEHSLLDFYNKVVTQTLDAERCSIFISDPHTGAIWLKAGTSMSERSIEVTQRSSMVGNVIRTGEAVMEEGLEHKDGAHREIDKESGFVTRNVMCLPIHTLDGQGVSGVVQVLNKRDGAFNANDEEKLKETLRFLELTIENIYINQEASTIMARMSRFMGAAIASIGAGVFMVVAALIVFWLTQNVRGG